jgi:hypothetical protein
MSRLALFALAVLAATAALLLTGCTPHVGDKCVLNTDCSLQGTRVCDNSQPNGYCTLFNCAPNSCPDNAACVMIYSEVPGCPYDGYAAPPRTGRTMCMASCSKDSDCRTQDGYVCRDPQQPPINGLVVDSNWQTVCVVSPDYSNASWPVGGVVGVASFDASPGDAAPVCQASGPPVTPYEASTPSEPGD